MKDVARRLVYTPKPPPLSWLQALGALAVGSCVVVHHTWRADRLVLVHQPGKVGSSSLVRAFAHAVPDGTAVLHTHRLDQSERRVELRERWLRQWAPRLMWGEAPMARRVAGRLASKSIVVTGIRNPVEREISAVLQNPDRYLGLSRSPRTRAEVEDVAPMLIDAVNRNLRARRLDRWFDHELGALLGGPVPWAELKPGLEQEGVASCRSARGTAFYILRFEDLDDAFRRVCELERLEPSPLPHANASASTMAFSVVRSGGLDAESLSAALDQRSVRAAYSVEQLDRWRQDWST